MAREGATIAEDQRLLPRTQALRRSWWLVLVALLAVTFAPVTARASDTVDEVNGVPVRLVAPALGVDAEVQTFALTENGEMPAPTVGTVAAWYTFSAGAGAAGNAVLAGHRDWQGRRGVFYLLGNLTEGDEIWLQDEGRNWYLYRVVWNVSYNEATAPIADIAGPTEGRAVTLITCAGVFDRRAGQYVERRVVRATYVATVPGPDTPLADQSLAAGR